jgi:hypothetical protein
MVRSLLIPRLTGDLSLAACEEKHAPIGISAEACPSIHQISPLLERTAAPIGSLDHVADPVS